MCAKELAAFLAEVVGATNTYDATPDAEGATTYGVQGLKVKVDKDCDPAINAPTADQIAYCLTYDGILYDLHHFYKEKRFDPTGKGFVPRGALMLQGIDEYFWYSQVMFGDNTLMADPSVVASDAGKFWSSAMFKWMVPMLGAPAPHNIIYGQWEPQGEEMDAGITDGYGAVTALLVGPTVCGMAKAPEAMVRKSVYEELIAEFKSSTFKADEVTPTWTAAETIYTWESNDCAESSRAKFPNHSDYDSFTQFLTPYATTIDWDDNIVTMESDTCFLTDERTDYIVMRPDAMRRCVIDNMNSNFIVQFGQCPLGQMVDPVTVECRAQTRFDCEANVNVWDNVLGYCNPVELSCTSK